MTGSSRLRHAPDAYFKTMGVSRCEVLLGTRRNGRVAWAAADGLMVQLVCYVSLGGDIVFHTRPDSDLARLRYPQPVAFEVDEIDPERGTAWSVLARGMSRAVTETDDLLARWSWQADEPWPSGSGDIILAITPRQLSGRVLKADISC